MMTESSAIVRAPHVWMMAHAIHRTKERPTDPPVPLRTPVGEMKIPVPITNPTCINIMNKMEVMSDDKFLK